MQLNSEAFWLYGMSGLSGATLLTVHMLREHFGPAVPIAILEEGPVAPWRSAIRNLKRHAVDLHCRGRWPENAGRRGIRIVCKPGLAVERAFTAFDYAAQFGPCPLATRVRERWETLEKVLLKEEAEDVLKRVREVLGLPALLSIMCAQLSASEVLTLFRETGMAPAEFRELCGYPAPLGGEK